MKYTITYPTEIGTLRLLSDEESLLALLIGKRRNKK